MNHYHIFVRIVNNTIVVSAAWDNLRNHIPVIMCIGICKISLRELEIAECDKTISFVLRDHGIAVRPLGHRRIGIESLELEIELC